MRIHRTIKIALALLMTVSFVGLANANDDKASTEKKVVKKPEFPPLSKVIEGYTEVKPKDDGTGKTSGYMKLWRRDKDGQMLAQLPSDYSSSKMFIATTVAGGEEDAGLQQADYYVYWKKYGKRLALISPNISIRGSDSHSKDSVNRLFTDTVILDVPILAMSGGPVIDLDSLLVGNASTFFDYPIYVSRPSLTTIKKAKVFKSNVEVAFEAPMAGGNLKTIHYSISRIKGSAGYKPRKADQRIGYFTTSYLDYGKYQTDDTRVRYINRWHVEKRKPKLKLSPPKKQIIFYVEHTTPVRYRRWVREGILKWNKAFEKVGILNAIEVRQQDKETNQHMDKDPEDVQYNFVRWLNNNISTAIGPSRVNPTTGEILDADIILTDGWIRVFENQFTEMMPKIAMESATPETKAWYATHPNWDPRIRLSDPADRDFIRHKIASDFARDMELRRTNTLKTKMMGDEPMDGIIGRNTQVNGSCYAAEGRQFDVALMRMMIALQKDDLLKKKAKKDEEEDDEEGDDEDDDEDDKDKKKDKDEDEDEEEKEQLLDGMPESFIGPLLADLVAHEVGHTLGLRHNFKASSVYTLKEMNSEAHKGKTPLAGSVMDYIPTNFNYEAGEIQGDYGMIEIGPYDMWAIEYGYTASEKSLKKILARVAEPELVFATDQDTIGPDPLAQRYDFGKDPLEFAENQMRLAKYHRGHILDKFVKEGDAWDRARQGYLLTLGLQTKATSMMSNWVGGVHVYNDKKGDPNARTPVQPVEADKQRAALKFVLENTMDEEVFGLTPELLSHMTSSGWRDRGFTDPTWPVHDRILGIQSSALSNLLNPSTLRRVYDNEFLVEDDDAFTLNELLDTVHDSVWGELDEMPKKKATVRKPAISSMRRNLQTEHLEKLFDLANEERDGSAAMKPIATLASLKLRDLHEKLDEAQSNGKLDPYTKAHLVDSATRIKKWIDSQYVTGTVETSGGGGSSFSRFFFKDGAEHQQNKK